jgi:hypothetical protein
MADDSPTSALTTFQQLGYAEVQLRTQLNETRNIMLKRAMSGLGTLSRIHSSTVARNTGLKAIPKSCPFACSSVSRAPHAVHASHQAPPHIPRRHGPGDLMPASRHRKSWNYLPPRILLRSNHVIAISLSCPGRLNGERWLLLRDWIVRASRVNASC